MNTPILLNRNLINFGIPLGLLVVIIFLMQSPFLKGNDVINFAITVDLLLTVPLIYFLLIRKSKIPKTTVIPVMVIGLLVGSYFLPKEDQTYLDLFKNWALPIIELSILTLVIIKVRKAVVTYKKLKNVSPDFYDTLKNFCSEILPKKLVFPFATEVAVFYYGFIHWKSRQPENNEYTYHKNSGTPALLGGFILVIAIETIALHYLLAQWNVIIAWTLTGLSIYTAVQLLVFAKALSKRPIIITEETLLLRYGIMNESQIPMADIDSVVLSKKELEKNKLTRTLSPLRDLESHNVIINLKRENTLQGVYGIKKNFKTIGLHIDEPHDFIEEIEKALQSN
ncbi:hypothetical protein E1176_03460 [Fulvivirga sp. RKSG066]|uniref:hypothetical protein n=1 Tax=Fulvivirga aurantia TaxID=2529383 RepID=UPI0012BCFFC5|nr:hypothetical protein [Fulvivirga aurantia]MTI20069.1 hypothetical protein [Fulvivirga aurantia]